MSEFPVSENIDRLAAQIKLLQGELEAEFAIHRAKLRYTLQGKRAVFEEEILRAHRELRVGLAKYVFNASLLTILTAPVIYAMIVPFVILDIAITIYQWICFPVYGIEKVKRSDYFIFDRYHLAYLNILEAINCAYCSYGNGLMAYASEISARTEQYWCPIKHARKVIAAHEHYVGFADFGDAETFRKKYGHLERGQGE
ncbi:MAG: hypothetical protein J0G37_04885 [Afipia sp.]|jgi:hypothetical protein|nr:hypothetical protein [Afipia sp.]